MNPIHLLLVLLPIALCLNLEIEDASNLHFFHILNVADTVGMAHILMTVNITQHLALIKQLCTLPPPPPTCTGWNRYRWNRPI
jgi:hypothetical protein